MIAVRLATIDDAEAIARHTSDIQGLHHEAMPDIFKQPSAELFPQKKLARLLRDANAIVAVAEIDGSVVGHIYGSIVNPTESEFHEVGAHMYVHQIAVDEGARRRGVGAALVGFIDARAYAMGLSAVQVDHWAFNARARGFFEASGFTPVKVTMRRAIGRRTS